MKCDNCPRLSTWLVGIPAALLIGAMLWFSGWCHGRSETFLEAVREGHAVWVPDKQTGKPYIEWIKK